MSNKKGFTLIEIIVVIVILGILATLAVPRLAGQFETAKASEAMDQLGVIKRAIISCYDASYTMATCQTWTNLGLGAPVATNFSYTVANNGVNSMHILADRVAQTTECIKMEVIGDSGATGMTGYGLYVGVVQRATSVAAGGTGANCTAY